jgi:glutamate/tyrosine decarboxylase-like PLP-dependent enzyme
LKNLLNKTAEYAADFLSGLDSRPVAPEPEALRLLAALDRPLPDQPQDPLIVLELLHQYASPAATGMNGGRYFGYVVGGSLPAALAANWLAGAWDQNAFSTKSSPMAALVEEVAVRWLLEVLGLPPNCGVGITTGATMANFSALAAARRAVLLAAGWDVDEDGLPGAPPLTVIAGVEAHPTVLKGLGLLGLGRKQVVSVPVDRQGRMIPGALPKITGPAIVILQAGNVNTGAFDPAAEIIPRVREAGAWVHVDGAFGLWAAASPQKAGLMAGFKTADSWATDGHKWLNLPYDCGLALVRKAEALRGAMTLAAPYLPVTAQRQPMDYTPEASRRARGVDLWAGLYSLGRTGLADLIDRTCRQARFLADGLREAGFEILNEVVLNQVLAAFGDHEATTRVIEGVQAEGTCWCGPTVWQGRTAMRLSVSSWATTDADVAKSLAAIVRVARGR